MKVAQLVEDYLAAAEMCLGLFEAQFGRRDLIRAWREGALPQTGELGDGVSYQLHGVGCAVEFREYVVDFDFSGWQTIGFDAWRLWSYAKQFPDRYPQYRERSAVEAAIAEEVAQGRINSLEGSSLLHLV